jgi:hypothetical protein
MHVARPIVVLIWIPLPVAVNGSEATIKLTHDEHVLQRMGQKLRIGSDRYPCRKFSLA